MLFFFFGITVDISTFIVESLDFDHEIENFIVIATGIKIIK